MSGCNVPPAKPAHGRSQHGGAGVIITSVTTHKPMTAITPDELLVSTAIDCGLHQWGVDGGSINVHVDELRPVLEEAYDPSMPDWPSLIHWDDEVGFIVA